jgi:hypothetical protein
METQEQIQGPEIVAEMEDVEMVAGAITDGSQAIAHDGFDVETFEQAADDYARLARTVDETAGAIRTGPALLQERNAGLQRSDRRKSGRGAAGSNQRYGLSSR